MKRRSSGFLVRDRAIHELISEIPSRDESICRRSSIGQSQSDSSSPPAASEPATLPCTAASSRSVWPWASTCSTRVLIDVYSLVSGTAEIPAATGFRSMYTPTVSSDSSSRTATLL